MKFAPYVRAFGLLRRRWFLLISSAALISMAHAQPVTNVQLAAPAQGSAAISALGAYLPTVAKAYGLNAQELVNLFQTQPSLGVDMAGALLFACDGLAVPADGPLVDGTGTSTENASVTSDALTATSSVIALALGGSVDAFKLHSLPGVSRVIYLDFDGSITSGTAWNSSYTGGAPIVSAPFDLDGDPTTFNSTERDMIQRIWQRVAEDYAPFAVDVTTEDPGVEGLRRTSPDDTAYGIRVVISPTNWYKSSAGGTAYIGSFNADTDTPCWVFTQQLANGEKYIAEAISHEVGHTVGLYHDGAGGASPTEYYQGQGNWAPIMGVGYYRPIVQFSKGEYAYANNTQDDLAVIASYVPLAGDDHGNTLATATVIPGTNVATGGTIETRNDVDVFRFDTGAGLISLSIQGPAPENDLDIKAELLDSSGQVLQTSDDSAVLSAQIVATVPPGTYYLRISGVGSGDPLSTGYSSYASIGNYVITGTLVSTGTKQAPVAVATASTTSGTAPLTVSFSGQGSTDSDGFIASYQWAFGTGDGAGGVNASYTYNTPGTYSAVLTVIDNDGLAGTANVTITVAASPNISPTAVALASATGGIAPVAVMFSSAGSSDPDGTIISYRWDFGDGTSSTAASPSKTYVVPGNYTARLTVTDDRGATASSTVGVLVLADPNTDAGIHDYTLSSSTQRNGTIVSAAISVFDRLGRPVAGATVTVQWSGLVSGSSTGKTDAVGAVIISAPRTRKTGTIMATITSVAPPNGSVYVPGLFGQPLTRSITLP